MVDTVRRILPCDIENGAAVFDIDETLLLNAPHDDGAIAPNPPVQELWNLMQARGVKCFVVTARERGTDAASYALRQLEKLGYTDIAGLYMVNTSHASDETPAAFKAEARRRIAHENVILLNVGDQWTDHVDGGWEQLQATEDSEMFAGILANDDMTVLSLKLPEHPR